MANNAIERKGFLKVLWWKTSLWTEISPVHNLELQQQDWFPSCQRVEAHPCPIHLLMCTSWRTWNQLVVNQTQSCPSRCLIEHQCHCNTDQPAITFNTNHMLTSYRVRPAIRAFKLQIQMQESSYELIAFHNTCFCSTHCSSQCFAIPSWMHSCSLWAADCLSPWSLVLMPWSLRAQQKSMLLIWLIVSIYQQASGLIHQQKFQIQPTKILASPDYCCWRRDADLNSSHF